MQPLSRAERRRRRRGKKGTCCDWRSTNLVVLTGILAICAAISGVADARNGSTGDEGRIVHAPPPLDSSGRPKSPQIIRAQSIEPLPNAAVRRDLLRRDRAVRQAERWNEEVSGNWRRPVERVPHISDF